jgi:hypothetical protein
VSGFIANSGSRLPVLGPLKLQPLPLGDFLNQAAFRKLGIPGGQPADLARRSNASSDAGPFQVPSRRSRARFSGMMCSPTDTTPRLTVTSGRHSRG